MTRCFACSELQRKALSFPPGRFASAVIMNIKSREKMICFYGQWSRQTFGEIWRAHFLHAHCDHAEQSSCYVTNHLRADHKKVPPLSSDSEPYSLALLYHLDDIRNKHCIQQNRHSLIIRLRTVLARVVVWVLRICEGAGGDPQPVLCDR